MQSQPIFRRIILGILGLVTSISIAMAPMPMGGMGGMGMPSVEDIQAMEAEIDKFVRSLPPEQQKQFYKDVEELTNIMEKMTPDELNEFVGNVFTDAGLIEQPAPAKPVAPKPEAVKKPEAKPAPVITTAPAAPTEKAVNMINAIIKRTEEFLRKTQLIPEIQAKMNKWVVQKKLLDVAANIDWQIVETQIEEMNVLLYHLKEIDPVTKQYKHIGNLIKDEALYNNLATLQVTLDAYIPSIEIPPFGLETVSKESRAAIREVLSQYLEAFYLLNIPTAIKKVKALYEPRAAQLKQEEMQSAEEAYNAAQKTRVPAPAVKSPGTKKPYTTTPYTTPSRYDYTPAPSYTPTPYTPSSYESRPSTSPASKPSTGGKSSAGKTSEAKEPKSAEEKIAKNIEEAGGQEMPGAPRKEGASVSEEEADIGYQIYDIAKQLNDGMKKSKEFEQELKNIGAQFYDVKGKPLADAKEDQSSIDNLKKRMTAIQEANASLKNATSDIKSLKDKIKKLSPEKQQLHKKTISSKMADAIKYYEAIRQSITSFMPSRASYMASLPNKYYIYFGEGASAQTPPSAAIKQAIPNVSVTLDTLLKSIDDFIKEAK